MLEEIINREELAITMALEEKMPDYVISAINDDSVERLQSFYLDSRMMRMLEAEAEYHHISVEELVRKIIRNHIER